MSEPGRNLVVVPLDAAEAKRERALKALARIDAVADGRQVRPAPQTTASDIGARVAATVADAVSKAAPGASFMTVEAEVSHVDADGSKTGIRLAVKRWGPR